MNISPISFRGQFAYNYNEATIRNNPLWHKNSSIEDTLGSYHMNKTGRAYFADPMEPVTDKIKESADYIVYDNEPAYPAIEDVKQNYLGTLRKNFKDLFEDVRLYFYRREMGGFASKPEAQYKQWEAAECTRMYDEAGDLRYKKEVTEDEITKLEERKANLTAGLKRAQEELSAQNTTKSHVERHIENLANMRKPYQELLSIAEKSSSNEVTTLDRLKDKKAAFSIVEQETKFKKEAGSLEKALESFEAVRKNILNNIEELTNRIRSIQSNLVSTNETIASRQKFVEECKSKLVPLFQELKNFYRSQGIQGLKKL